MSGAAPTVTASVRPRRTSPPRRLHSAIPGRSWPLREPALIRRGAPFLLAWQPRSATRAAGTTKIATIDVTQPVAVCTGIATTQTGTCTACANLGLGGAPVSGATAATCVSSANSPCCNLPVFYLAFTNTTVSRYAMLEFIVLTNVSVRDTLPLLRLRPDHVQSGRHTCPLRR